MLIHCYALTLDGDATNSVNAWYHSGDCSIRLDRRVHCDLLHNTVVLIIIVVWQRRVFSYAEIFKRLSLVSSAALQ